MQREKDIDLGPSLPCALMPERIIKVAAEHGVPQEAVFEQAKRDWKIPTVASWEMFKRFPYA